MPFGMSRPVIRSTRAALDTDEPMSDGRLSPLLQRFNGVMLGFFAQMSPFHAVREQWPSLQTQMSHFVSEINLPVQIPKDVKDFADHRGEVARAVLDLGDHMSTFQVAFGLGYAFGGLISGVDVMPRSGLEGGMSALGLDPALLDGWIANISRDEQGRANFN